jgi:hypothetical protein
MSPNNRTKVERLRVAEAVDASRRAIGAHPLPSVLTVFGLGVGVGLLIATTLLSSTRQQEETLTRRISQQVLGALSSVLPDRITQHVW